MDTPRPKSSSRTRATRKDDVRAKALLDLQRYHVLMVDGHFDYGNGYHGRVYVNPHKLFQEPSLIWRLAQDLIDLLPGVLVDQAEVVAGPVTGGALLAHTIAGLLDGRRNLSHAPARFAPFTVEASTGLVLRQTYARTVLGKRVLLADDVRNTGKTLGRCAELIVDAGGDVIGSMAIHDRLESVVDLGVPHVALAEYKVPTSCSADKCPMCATGMPITTF